MSDERSGESSTRTGPRSVLREPLVYFLAGGALLFALDRATATRRMHRNAIAETSTASTIVVSDRFVRALREQQQLRTGRVPTSSEEAGLVADFVREEALYREARTARLDAGDLIVRRRLVQKAEFLLGAQVQVPEPSDAELEAWRIAHVDELREAPRVSFEQVYFSHDRRGEHAGADARAALSSVQHASDGAHAIALGDPFLPGHVFISRSERDVAATFGPAFARALESTPEGIWTGPIESPYGAHLVRVSARTPGRDPTLDEVRPFARQRWMDARREALTEQAISRVVGQYRVVRARDDQPDPDAGQRP